MSTYGYFKQDAMSDYAIAHHGIKGQKWGVRRFQNEDGSLTEEGKKRYSEGGYGYTLNKKGLKKLDSNAFNKYRQDKLEREKKETIQKHNKAIKEFKDVDMIGDGSFEKNPKRSIAAAKLGLKALKEMNRDTGDDDEGSIDWFLYEDQTIGLPTIADLVNQGYSKNRIKKLIEAAQDVDVYGYSTGNNNPVKTGIWDLNEGYAVDTFVDACFKVKNKK